MFLLEYKRSNYIFYPQRLFMKKLLLPLVAASLLTVSTVQISAEASASVKGAAYVKTAFDILSWPLFIFLTAGLVGKALKQPFTNCTEDFLDAGIAKWLAYGTGMGLGALAGMAARAAYTKMHTLGGFTDDEIKEISNVSLEQKLWIAAQVAPILLFIAEFNAAREREKERERERAREKERPTLFAVFR
jgi:hypothetical protein